MLNSILFLFKLLPKIQILIYFSLFQECTSPEPPGYTSSPNLTPADLCPSNPFSNPPPNDGGVPAPAVLPAMEQSPTQPPLRVRGPPQPRGLRGRHPGLRRAQPQGAQDGALGLLALLPVHVLQHARQAPRGLPQGRPLRGDEGAAGVHVQGRGLRRPGEPLLPPQGGRRPQDQRSGRRQREQLWDVRAQALPPPQPRPPPPPALPILPNVAPTRS